MPKKHHTKEYVNKLLRWTMNRWYQSQSHNRPFVAGRWFAAVDRINRLSRLVNG